MATGGGTHAGIPSDVLQNLRRVALSRLPITTLDRLDLDTLVHMPCIVRADRNLIKTKVKNDGDRAGLSEFLNRVWTKNNSWWADLVHFLRDPEYCDQEDIAIFLEEELEKVKEEYEENGGSVFACLEASSGDVANDHARLQQSLVINQIHFHISGQGHSVHLPAGLPGGVQLPAPAIEEPGETLADLSGSEFASSENRDMETAKKAALPITDRCKTPRERLHEKEEEKKGRKKERDETLSDLSRSESTSPENPDNDPQTPGLDGLETGRYSSVADLRSSREFRALYSHPGTRGFSDDCLPGMMATFRDVMQDHLIPDQLMTKMPMFRALRNREAIEAEKVPRKQRLMFLSALEESRMGGRLQQFLDALKETGCCQLYTMLTGELFKEQCSENEETFKCYRLALEERIDSTDIVSSLVDLGCLHRIDTEEIQTRRDQKGKFEGMKLLLDRLYQKNPLTSARDILEAVHKVDRRAVELLEPDFKPKRQRAANHLKATAGPAVAKGSSQSQSRPDTPIASTQASASHVHSSSARSVSTASSASSLAGSSKPQKDLVTKQLCLEVLQKDGGWMTALEIVQKLGIKGGGKSLANPHLNVLVDNKSVEKDKSPKPRYRSLVDN